MGLKFDIGEADIERGRNSRLIRITLRCATVEEAAAFYEDVVDAARGGEIRLRLGHTEVVQETRDLEHPPRSR